MKGLPAKQGVKKVTLSVSKPLPGLLLTVLLTGETSAKLFTLFRETQEKEEPPQT